MPGDFSTDFGADFGASPTTGATYLFLQDHFAGGRYITAGTTASDASLGGILPIGWKPTPNVDPLNAPALTMFYLMGPAQPQQVLVVKPTTYWTNIGHSRWALTGLGSSQVAYPPIGI